MRDQVKSANGASQGEFAMTIKTFVVAFRLKSDASYEERWTSVDSAIRRQSEDSVWSEMTSMYVLRSSLSADELASRIYLGSDLLPSRDKLIVIDTASSSYAVRGKIDYPATLKSLFPKNALAGLLSA